MCLRFGKSHGCGRIIRPPTGSAIIGPLLALLFTAPGYAQTSTDPSSQGVSKPAEATSEDTGLSEIVVTAQRRSENLQRVPVAVTVISQEALQSANIQTPSQLIELTPSLQRETTNNQVGSTNFSIRGIGTAVYGPQIESSVALVIDDITMGRPQFGVVQFYDIDHIEVLRGPQGMLFGKNASAGLISIVTGQPQISNFESKASITYGNRDTDVGGAGQETVEGMINIPTGPTSAFRASTFYTHNDAFIENTIRPKEFLGMDEYGLRTKYLWESDEGWRVLMEADYIHEVGAGNSAFSRRFDAAGGFVASRDSLAGITPGPDNLQIASNDDTSNRFDSGGGQINISYKTADGPTFTNIAAYRTYVDASTIDLDFTPDSFWNATASRRNYWQFSDELRVTSPSNSKVEYQFGLYYLDLYAAQPTTIKLDLGPLLAAPVSGSYNIGSLLTPRSSNRSYAGFGQGSYNFTERLRLTAGGRFTRDDSKFVDTFYSGNGTDTFLAPLFPLGQFANSKTQDNFSWRTSAQYDFAPTVMGYITWARGYKGPGFDQLSAALVQPEIAYDTEVGLKATLFDRRLDLNFVLFNENIHNFQAQAHAAGGNGFTTLNAGNLRSRGAEIEFRSRPIEALTIGGGVTYNHAIYQSFKGAPCYTGEPNGVSGTDVCLPDGTTDASGNQLANAPTWTATLSANYDWGIFSGLRAFFGADVYYRSSSFFDPAGDPRTKIDPYGSVGLTMGVHSSTDRWRVAAFVRNLTDKRIPSYIFSDPLSGLYGDAAKGGNYWQQFDENSFRTIGLNFSYRF